MGKSESVVGEELKYTFDDLEMEQQSLNLLNSNSARDKTLDARRLREDQIQQTVRRIAAIKIALSLTDKNTK